MIKTISIQFKAGSLYGGYAQFLRDKSWEFIYFDITEDIFPMVIVDGRNKRISEKDADQFERELFSVFFVHGIPLQIGTFSVAETVNRMNRRVEIEMKNNEQKQVCLLVNLGGFERRMDENLKLAEQYGKVVYSLTGDGLVNILEGPRVPVNITQLTTQELHVWSTMINEQLQEAGFPFEEGIILAAGRNYRGTMPLGTIIRDHVRIGA